MNSFKGGLEMVVHAASSGRKAIALAAAGLASLALVSTGCTTSYDYTSAVRDAENIVPYANGQTIQGTIVGESRNSVSGFIAGVPGDIEQYTIMVKTPEGGCYLLGAAASTASEGGAKAAEISDLDGRLRLGFEVRVTGVNPGYTGIGDKCRAPVSTPAMTIKPSQVEVVK